MITQTSGFDHTSQAEPNKHQLKIISPRQQSSRLNPGPVTIHFIHERSSTAALDISTGPLARRTFQTAGPVRASTFYLSLARTGHLDICRATRFQIVLARTMTIHSMYFSRGRPSHISAVFAQPFCYSETPACRESESGMSIKHVSV